MISEPGRLKTGKTLGGIGAILLAVGSFGEIALTYSICLGASELTFPSAISGVLGLVGIILVLIGMKNLAEHYRDDGIYRNALYGFIFGIIGVVAVASVVITLLFGWFFEVGSFSGILGAIILTLLVVFIFYVLEAVYCRRALDSLADKSGEKMFDTAGLLLLIGAALTIILVGLIIVFSAWILVAVAFFSIREPATPATSQPTASSPPSKTA
ncbi:MAG: DUF996 domain-containing protein [Candidatus Bathyarchaeia archaeon]